MRDRLIELLKRKSCEYVPCDGDCRRCKNVEMFDDSIESIADHLLAAGVIVPPFPIGTKYYRIVTRSGKFAGEFRVIREAILNYYNIDNVLRDFGKTVFLSREDAEQALKEAQG